tara:strand:- start:224 stop:1144 length:921 start_codon:yes stop_codon:yes gene_type:complete
MFCKGQDTAFANDIPLEYLMKCLLHSQILTYTRKRIPLEFTYFLVLHDNNLLISLLDNLARFLSFIKRKPHFALRITWEPYLKSKLVSRISFGNKFYKQGKRIQIHVPATLVPLVIDAEVLPLRSYRFKKLIDSSIMHSSRKHSDISTMKPYSAVIFSGVKYPFRDKLVDAIENVIPIEKLGKAYNRHYEGTQESLSSKHIFCFCPENSLREGYCCQKAIEAYFSGFIPIYWCHPDNYKNILNPKALINIYGLSKKQVKELLVSIINDESKLKAIYEEPIYHSDYTIESEMLKFEMSFSEAIKSFY